VSSHVMSRVKKYQIGWPGASQEEMHPFYRVCYTNRSSDFLPSTPPQQKCLDRGRLQGKEEENESNRNHFSLHSFDPGIDIPKLGILVNTSRLES